MDESESSSSLAVSVLIVSYNCETALRRCLAALKASEGGESFEIIVVDCVSRDGSGQLDDDYPDISLLRLPRNLGYTRARNIGARTARGDYLFLLEPEVEVRPDTIVSLHAKFKEGSKLTLASPLLVDADGKAASRVGTLPDPATLFRAWAAGERWEDEALGPVPEGEGPLEVDCPDPRAVMLWTQSLRGMNYFDERYGEFGPDIELFTQVYRASKRAVVFRGITAIVHGNEGLWSPASEAERTCLAADFGNGLVAYTGKHYGWLAGFKMRLRVLLHALGEFRLGLLGQLLGGQTVDGSQRAL